MDEIDRQDTEAAEPQQKLPVQKSCTKAGRKLTDRKTDHRNTGSCVRLPNIVLCYMPNYTKYYTKYCPVLQSKLQD
jgi:hypothetical protein